MLRRCQELKPQARMEGFTVQEMIRRGGAHELLAGIATDPTFGPVILFGRGGTDVELIGDRALALPPLTATLAREVISRTRVSRLLAASRGRPAADQEAIEADTHPARAARQRHGGDCRTRHQSLARR